ncbi:gasdermin-A-like isoform X2 [Chamaea fasciata]|uniref:gasdermin-A-like isoform X2 n=1 Tax=Chamaea fasciata TaxID=190680 RepID=UPI00336A5187
MFKKLTKLILKQMDPRDELVPVESIAHNEHFRPLYLLIKKRKSKRIFHPDPYYQHTRFTLDDVLLPGEDGNHREPIYQVSSQFTLTQTSVDQAGGGLSISFDPASAGLQGAASLSNEFSITVQKKSISQESLEALRTEREIDMDHSFIQQLQRTDIELYVVTEILEASEEAVYKESTKAGGGFNAKCYARASAQGTRENTQSIVVPKGCTLAFRLIQIHIKDGAWSLGHIPKKVKVIRSLQALSGKGIVESEVEKNCQIFLKFSSDLLLIVLNTIKAVMTDKNLLEELSQKMEEVPEQNDGYELKTESPDLQGLFSTLQHSPRDRVLLLAEGITYILDALHELMEDQLLLLLESLERKIVSQQLKLVENLLTPHLKYGMQPFHVDAELLSFPHVEEQMLTIALVELSGVQLQEDGSAVPRDQPFEAVAALFVALYALNLLSGSK